MTRRITLVAAAGVAVLALSASAAFAQAPIDSSALSKQAAFGVLLQRGAGTFGQPNSIGYRGAFERTVPPAGPADVATIGSGRGIEWPQIGVGFGAGLMLALGLVLGLRYTRVRQLAH